MTPPLLAHHNLALPIFLFTDASDFTISGIPHQQDEAGDLHPLAFYLRKLLESEINYSIHNKEMLGIMESLREFRPWLVGLELPISIITDHKNLEYFMNLQCLNHRQARWALELSEINFKLSFTPGKDNPVDVPLCHPDFIPADGNIAKEVNWQTLLAPQHMERLWVAASSTNTAPSMTISTIPAPILATTMPPVTPLPPPISPPSSSIQILSPAPSISLDDWNKALTKDETWKEGICSSKKDWKLENGNPLFRHKLFVPPESCEAMSCMSTMTAYLLGTQDMQKPSHW